MTKGLIHSIESMGLVDGPGIRTVVFMQGCQLRCIYCHNPDTWSMESGKAQEIYPDELVERIERFKPYFGVKGGVTFSGGEPLMQPDFLAEALELCKARGIGTCLDTAGAGRGSYDSILQNTDLVLLDIKHYTPEGYRQITGREMDMFNMFLEDVQKYQVPMWIRHVVVPGYTDAQGHLEGLEKYISSIRGVRRVELLAYHTLGVHKYKEMGIEYRLDGVPAMEENKLESWNKRLNSGLEQ